MITPSKFTEIDQSAMAKSVFILDALSSPMMTIDLYKSIRNKYENPEEFILSLDVLWITKMIDFDKNSGVISHAS